MSDTITLNTPLTRPSITDYQPLYLMIRVSPSAEINVSILSNIGAVESFAYPAAGTSYDTSSAVLTLIGNLNTANLSTRSLWKRVFDRLVADFPSRFNGGATVS